MSTQRQLNLSALGRTDRPFTPLVDKLYFGDVTALPSIHHSYANLPEGEEAELYLLFPEGPAQTIPVEIKSVQTIKFRDIQLLTNEELNTLGYSTNDGMMYDLLDRYDGYDIDDDTEIHIATFESKIADHITAIRNAVVDKIDELHGGYMDSYALEFTYTRHVDEQTGEVEHHFDWMVDLPEGHNLKQPIQEWLRNFTDTTETLYDGRVLYFSVTDDPALIHHKMKVQKARQAEADEQEADDRDFSRKPDGSRQPRHDG